MILCTPSQKSITQLVISVYVHPISATAKSGE